MADKELGLKALGVCLTPFLEHGGPSNNTVDTILREVDNHLSENQTRIEECVKELMEMSQTLSGVSYKFTHPTEALTHITENRLLDKEICFDPDTDAIVKLLRSVLHTIEKNQGCEEKILGQLFELSAAEGMALPFRTTSDPVGQSVVSINAAVDSTEHIVEKLWNEVCLKMKKYYSQELRNLPTNETRPTVSWNHDRPLRCVKALCSLFPTDKVWTLYNNIRCQQLDGCIKKYVTSHAGKARKGASLAAVAEQFKGLTRCVLLMVRDDFEMLSSGVFSDVVSPIDGLSEIYLDRLTEEINAVVDVVMEDLGNYPAGKSPKWDKKRKVKDSVKEISKSPSDVGFLGHRKVGTPKLQSKSADNLLRHEEELQFSDLQVLPHGFLEPVTQLICDILQLEKQLSGLHSATLWESLASVGLKPVAKQTLKSALKSSHKLEEIKKSAFSPRSFENSGLLPEAIPPPYGASQTIIAQLSASLKVVEKPVDDSIQWSWRKCFTKLVSDLAKSIEYHINTTANTAVHDMEAVFSSNNRLPMVAVPTNLVGGRLDYPSRVSQGVLVLMTELDRLLPLARAGPKPPFDMVRAAFIDAAVISLKHMNQSLTKLCAETGTKLPQKCLYDVLSTMSYVRNHLLYYENSLGTDDSPSKKRAFPSLYRQFCDSVDQLTRRVIDHHNHVLVTSVLHDADSHHWENSKDFYEGERCSFAIQMWYLHMSCLRCDLWAGCPPKLAQTLFTTILQESLAVFCQRYCHVKPSYRRTGQFRMDITAILLCTSELLYHTAGSAILYLDPTTAHADHLGIHTSCSMLLAAMAVVTAPIDNLYKVYKKGFKKKRSLSDEDTTKGYVSHWLSWLRPQLLPLGKTTPDELQTTSALYLHLRLLTSKADINWTLLLQCLLMKDFTLPIMLLTNLALQISRASHDSEHSGEAHHKNSKGKHSSKHPLSAAEAGVSEEIFRVFTTFLLQCGEFPSALAKVLLPVFERSDSWTFFDENFSLASPHKMPVWLSAIFECMDSYTIRALDPGLRVLLTRHNEPVGREPIALRLRNLPCGCSASSETQAGNPLGNKVLTSTSEVVCHIMERHPQLTGSKDVLSEALYSIITQLVGDVYMLPASLVTFFKAAQHHVAGKGLRTPHGCLGIKILATALNQRLSDVAFLEALIGEPLPDGLRDNVALLAECVYHVLTAASFGGSPPEAGMFMRSNRNWVSDQIAVLADHFSNEAFQLTDDHPLEGTTVEFLEAVLTSQACSILSLDKGEDGLRKMYNFIANNERWILAQLDIPPLLGSQTTRSVGNLRPCLKPPKPAEWNPLKAYKSFKGCQFDQAAVAEFPWDWSAMLYSDLGLSEIGFRTLLFNRHEMQDSAYLEEQEKKPVEHLRKRFHADSPEL